MARAVRGNVTMPPLRARAARGSPIRVPKRDASNPAGAEQHLLRMRAAAHRRPMRAGGILRAMIDPAVLRGDASEAASRAVDANRTLALARDVLDTEARAIASLAARLGGAFVAAVELVLRCRGRVVVSGIGKSGHVARKLAATLASTGTPAFFVHPAEASHGDLGMITADDVVLALSNSGETDELLTILPVIKRQGAALVAMTGRPDSTLAREADIHLDAAVEMEACPLGLAPTTSSLMQLALGD